MRDPGLAACVLSLPMSVAPRVSESFGKLLGDFILDVKLENFLLSSFSSHFPKNTVTINWFRYTKTNSDRMRNRRAIDQFQT